MRLSILSGTLVALITGISIAAQSTITSRVGAQVGDVRTGLLTNALGGLIAGSLVAVWILKDGPEAWRVPLPLTGLTALSGALGILIITGISYSLQRAGVAAGLATVIFGQLLLSTLIDSLGLGGAEAIPLTISRVAGLILAGAGVFLLLPTN